MNAEVVADKRHRRGDLVRPDYAVEREIGFARSGVADIRLLGNDAVGDLFHRNREEAERENEVIVLLRERFRVPAEAVVGQVKKRVQRVVVFAPTRLLPRALFFFSARGIRHHDGVILEKREVYRAEVPAVVAFELGGGDVRQIARESVDDIVDLPGPDYVFEPSAEVLRVKRHIYPSFHLL